VSVVEGREGIKRTHTKHKANIHQRAETKAASKSAEGQQAKMKYRRRKKSCQITKSVGTKSELHQHIYLYSTTQKRKPVPLSGEALATNRQRFGLWPWRQPTALEAATM